jgi:hypothetical protein
MEVVQIGHVIEGSALNRLPEGTTVSLNRRVWTRQPDRSWVDTDGLSTTASTLARSGRAVLVRLPDGGQRLQLPPRTVQQVKWDFRVGAISAATNHGVGPRVALRALNQMDAGPVPIGTDVRVATGDEALPDDTVVYVGDPEQPSRFGVFRKKSQNVWEPVLGELRGPSFEAVVDSVAGVRERPGWLDEVGTDEDAEAIREFKSTAWRVGWEVKRSQSWCGTYDEIMHGLGVSRSDSLPTPHFAPGLQVEAELVRHMPEGSLLIWRHSSDLSRWAIFVRDLDGDNRAGTLRVCGTEPGHENVKRRMTVLAVAGRNRVVDWPIPPDPPGIFDLLPPGALVQREGQMWTKQGDGSFRSGAQPTYGTGPITREDLGDHDDWTLRRVTL